MPFAEALSRRFAPVVRARGAEYVRSGAVRLESCTRRRVKATVTDTSPYAVEVRGLEGGLVASCGCPFLRQHGPCKHVWAVLLRAEREGALAVLDGAGTNKFEAVVSLAALDIPVVPALPASDAVAAPAEAPSAPAPAWAALLDGIRAGADLEPARPAGRGRELVYLIVPDAQDGDGRLRVRLMERTRRPGSEPGTIRPATPPSPYGLHGHPAYSDDPLDRALLSLLRSESPYAPSVYHFVSAGPPVVNPTTFEIDAALAETVLPLLGQTGRLVVANDDPAAPPTPIACDDGPAWELTLKVSGADDSGRDGFVVTGELRRGDDMVDLQAPRALVAAGWVVFADRLARFRHFGVFPLAQRLRTQGRITVPLADENAFLQRLFALPALPRLELPSTLSFVEERPPLRPRLRLVSSRRGFAPDELAAEVTYAYGDVLVPREDRRQVAVQVEKRRLIHRDRSAERAAFGRLLDLGFRIIPGGYADQPENLTVLAARRLPTVVRTLVGEGWHVEAQGKVYRHPGAFRLSVTSGIDWFDLEGRLDFDGVEVGLPALLAAARGDGVVALGDGSVGMLPEDWLARYGLLARMGSEEGEALRFRTDQATLLDALLAAEPEASFDETFTRVRDELTRFEGIAPLPAPPGFGGVLRPYQEAGLGWMAFLRRFGLGGCLADDMGLGKTVQVLAMLEARRQDAASRADAGQAEPQGTSSLVVVPKSLVWNWVAEARRFAPDLRVLVHAGTERARQTDALQGYDVVLTTYGTLKNDVRFLRSLSFDYVVLDEAQAIKNADSGTSKAVRLLKGKHRLALTGTPVENHIGELWSLLDFLNPGMVGGVGLLRGTGGPGKLNPPELQAMAKALRPFILRRTKEQVAPELPAKHEETLVCEMEPLQRRLYEELREHYRASVLADVERHGLAQSKLHVLEALLRLRQAACHPGLLDEQRADDPSAKLDVLIPRLLEVAQEGHKALVFSQFTSLLALVRRRLEEAGITYEYLDGSTVDRRACVERFQADAACPVFLLSLKAGGVGLNLTAADYVFILDPWWNPAVEAQAVDRAHRIGQTKRVFVYRLLCRDTVEEKIAALQESKRALADAIVGAENSLIGGLDRATLELLLS